MIPVKLRKRGAWPGVTEPLKGTLVDLERNVEDAVDALQARKRPAWNPVNLTTATYQAQPWDFVIVRQDATIVFPAGSPSNIVSEIAVAKIGAPTVLITPVGGLINGAASAIGPASNRCRVYVSTGESWVSIA